MPGLSTLSIGYLILFVVDARNIGFRGFWNKPHVVQGLATFLQLPADRKLNKKYKKKESTGTESWVLVPQHIPKLFSMGRHMHGDLAKTMSFRERGYQISVSKSKILMPQGTFCWSHALSKENWAHSPQPHTATPLNSPVQKHLCHFRRVQSAWFFETLVDDGWCSLLRKSSQVFFTCGSSVQSFWVWFTSLGRHHSWYLCCISDGSLISWLGQALALDIDVSSTNVFNASGVYRRHGKAKRVMRRSFHPPFQLHILPNPAML